MSWPLLIAVVGTFVAVATLAAVLVQHTFAQFAPGRRRLHALTDGSPQPMLAGVQSLQDRPSWFVEVASQLIPKSRNEMDKVQRHMARAGHDSREAAIFFSLSEMVVPVLLATLAIATLGWATGVLFAIGGAIVGYLIPGFVLIKLIERRRSAISDGLPDALDLMGVCLEAGCSLDQAILKTSEELTLVCEPLAYEMKMLTTETRAGKPRIEAFKNIEVRTKNDDVRGLVAMLVQTDRFGTSVSQALRTLSDVTRTKRRQRAEERGAKVGVKLVFPLVLCLFPALYIVILGPAVVQIVRVFLEK